MKKMILLVTFIIGFSLGGKNIALGGELIDKNNWQKVKDTFPMIRMLEDVKKGIYTVNVVPTRPMKAPKYFDELTRKNAGLAKLTPAGHLPNALYKGGIPFPSIDPKDPQAGTKLMWNYFWRYQGDDYIGEYDRFCFDKLGRRVDAGVVVSIMRAVGRGIVPPTPSIPGDEELEIFWMTINTYPRDASGTVTLALRPNDPDKYDTMWRFFPSVRRVRRLPSTERYAAMPPTDYILDDTLGFSGKVTHFTHKLMGEKKVLVPAHLPPSPYKLKMRPGYPFPVDLDWELRDSWVVEQVARPDIYPKYAYGKRVFTIDKENFGINSIIIYDRKGEYWKDTVFTYSEAMTKAGETVVSAYGNAGFHDFQSSHSTVSQTGSPPSHDSGLSREDFGIDKLLEVSRMGRIRAK